MKSLKWPSLLLLLLMAVCISVGKQNLGGIRIACYILSVLFALAALIVAGKPKRKR